MSTMPQCQSCSALFPQLKTEICGLCSALEGKSLMEAEAIIQSKQQCAACGMVATFLKDPLCGPCRIVYGQISWDDIPFELRVNCKNLYEFHAELRTRAKAAPPEQPSGFATGSQPYTGLLNSPSHAVNCMRVADEFRVATNSGERLGQLSSREINDNLKRANATKALNSIMVRNQRGGAYKALGSITSDRVQITVTLWYAATVYGLEMMGKRKAGENIKTSLVFSRNYGPEFIWTDALDQLFEDIKAKAETDETTASFKMSLSHNCDLIAERGTSLNAVSLIPEKTLKSIGRTVEDLYRLFNNNNWGPATKLKSREISLRILYKGESALETVQEENSDEEQPQNKRVRTRNQSQLPAQPIESNVRYSRYRQKSVQLPKAIRWSRDPTMVMHYYVALELKQRGVDQLLNVYWVERSEDSMEKIEIAIMESWTGAMKSPREVAYQTNSGLIGEGFSKVAVYARIKGQEYALTQHKLREGQDKLREQDIFNDLKAEHMLLYYAHIFKSEFDDFAKEAGVDLSRASFYFPWESTVFGKLTPNDYQSVHYDYFLATPLLPCRASDRGMIKFTGSDGPGTPPSTHVAHAVHAFVHFSYLYSGKEFLFSDLQGMFNPSTKTFCLFDLQCHRNIADPVEREDMHWDSGPRMIDEFVQEHAQPSHCFKNKYCNKLDLRNTIFHFEGENSDSEDGRGPEDHDNGNTQIPSSPPVRSRFCTPIKPQRSIHRNLDSDNIVN